MLKPLHSLALPSALGSRDAVGVMVSRGTFAPTGNPVLSNIELRVDPNSSVALVGPSGSGKTSLLRCIAGLQSFSSGKVSYYTTANGEIPLKAVRIGFVFQDLGIFERSTARQNIQLGEKGLLTRPDAQSLIDHLEIGSILDRKVDNLSGGERQRVALARSLVRQPQVLFLDEPFSSVDRALSSRLEIMLSVIRATRPFTLLYVTHNILSAARLSSQIAFVHSGKLQQIGMVDDFQKRPTTVEAMNFFSDPPPVEIQSPHWNAIPFESIGAGKRSFFRADDLHVCVSGTSLSDTTTWANGRVVHLLEQPDARYALVELSSRPERTIACRMVDGATVGRGESILVWGEAQNIVTIHDEQVGTG